MDLPMPKALLHVLLSRVQLPLLLTRLLVFSFMTVANQGRASRITSSTHATPYHCHIPTAATILATIMGSGRGSVDHRIVCAGENRTLNWMLPRLWPYLRARDPQQCPGD